MSDIHEEINASETPRENAGKNSACDKKCSMHRIVTVIIIVAIVTAAVVFVVRGGAVEKMSDYFAAQKAVATVNGTKITQGDLFEILAQVAPGQEDAVDESIRAQVLEDLVSVRLLVSTAKENGVTVTDDEVQSELDTIIEQVGGEDAFVEQLEQANMTEKSLREDILEELLMQKLLAQETDIEELAATEEEITQAYNDAVASATEAGVADQVPALAEVRDVIKQQIEQEKQLEIVNVYVDTLRETADIEITL